MIEGIKIDVSSDELRDHLQARANYHDDKQAFYSTQAQSLKDGGIRSEAAVSNDPVNSLEQSARSHGEREAFFRFLAEHLVDDETYRLSEQDLTRIEIVSRYF